MPKYTLRIIGPANATFGDSTPFDGKYVVHYDPEFDYVAPNGQRLTCVLNVTSIRWTAKQFDSHLEALEYWRKQCQRTPLRPDGEPNRPLTYFTCVVEPLDG